MCLSVRRKKTDRRYQSAAELIVDLKKSLVMPDEDFVRMGSAYDSVLKKDEEEYNPDDDELLTENAGHDWMMITKIQMMNFLRMIQIRMKI